MKNKVFLISVLAIVFFALSGIPVNAGDEVSAPVNLGKAVADCQKKVRELERKVINLENGRSRAEPGTNSAVAPQDRDAECTYGSAYYGFMLDN